jgi:putative ABC transport system permease protein
MLRSYLKIAWRNLRKDRQFTVLNLIGLSTGLACALLIGLWVSDELKVDKFHKKDRQLFQVMQNIPEADGILTIEHTPGLLANALKEEMPEVEEAAIATPPMGGPGTKGILSIGDVNIKAGELYVSSNYLNVFSYKLVHGDQNKVLSNKYAVLLSDEMAMKLFHTTENSIGKTVTWNRGKLSGQYIVSGVFEKPPAYSSAQFDLLFNYDVFFEKYADNLQKWGNSNPFTYVVLKEGTDIVQFGNKINKLRLAKLQLTDPKALKDAGTLFVQRYSEKYLYNTYENGVQAGGRIAYVKLFSMIALFILVIACINFMNLSTAKATSRMKEVGIKKVVGASRGTLILQYLGESVLMAFLSVILATVLVTLLLPQFNVITGKQLTLHVNTAFILPVLGITLFTGLVAGSYPALYLSGFKPVAILKGKLQNSISELLVRKGLVVFQFAISVVLIVSVFVVYKQIRLIQSKNLGYNKDNIIQFASEGKLRGDLETFLPAVRNMPGVVGASSFSHTLTGDYGGTSAIRWQGKDPALNIRYAGLNVDYGLMEMFGFTMVQGRSFSREFGSDSAKIIFNEAAIAAMGLKDPIGKTVVLWGKERQIIGVVKNFNFESLYEEVKPCFLNVDPNRRYVLVKIKAGMESATIGRIRKLYQSYNQGIPFEYTFLDDDYQAMYTSENRVAILSGYFAGMAIIISCLGLFGLAAFTALKRQKEIGVRKVVGASVSHVVTLLSKDFLKLVVMAMLVAFPVAWWAMNQWLNDFAYRIPLSADIFVVVGLLTLVITLLTISFQTIKAALANPVKSLRSE